MYAFNMDVYSHHFVLSGFARESQRIITEYAREFIEYQIVRSWSGDISKEQVRIFAASNKERTYYRFHINALPGFISFLNTRGYTDKHYTRTDHPLYIPVSTELKLLPHAVARENQVPLIEHLCKPITSVVLTLQTGGGKTFCSLEALSKANVRTAVVIRPMYIKRWIDALMSPKERMLELVTEDLVIVQGTKPLINVIAAALEGTLTAKIIIISNATLRLFYSHFSETGDTTMYGIHPVDLYKTLGVGIRLIDEVHQDFHFNFLQDLYSHVPKTISLSATLVSDSPFINRMYKCIFPPEARTNPGEHTKYIAVKALTYSLANRESVKYMRRGRQSYSHIDFEQSIMRSGKMTKNYCNMIDVALKQYYFPDVQTGQKAIVYAATIDMCNIVKDDLRKRYPSLTINKYTAEDSYENLMESDICVSTIGSSGTAVDIPNLKYCLSTTSIGKTETNLQVMGRLRQSKQWPDMTPVFSYFVCLDIDKQVSYHTKKITKFKGKVLSHQTVELDMKL